jgi:hypothetical protein
VLLPHLQQGRRAVILAEEWQTVHAVLHLDWLLRQAGVRHQVTILWNANNTFSFHRIDWARLAQAAVITTVSRYMKQVVYSYLADNSNHPKSDIMPLSHYVLEGQGDGFTSFVLSARLIRIHLDFCHLAPHSA